MEQKELPIRIIDQRNPTFYWTDREFLNGYAKYVGWNGQCVYHALCRHEKNGIAFPSIQHLAIELGISEASVKRGVDNLVKWNIIAIKRIRGDRGRFIRNEYRLLSKEEWTKKLNQRWSNKKEIQP